MYPITIPAIGIYIATSIFITSYTKYYFEPMLPFAYVMGIANMFMMAYLLYVDRLRHKRDDAVLVFPAMLPGLFGLLYQFVGEERFSSVDYAMSFIPASFSIFLGVAVVNSFHKDFTLSTSKCEKYFDLGSSLILVSIGSVMLYMTYGTGKPEDYAVVIVASYVILAGLLLTTDYLITLFGKEPN